MQLWTISSQHPQQLGEWGLSLLRQRSWQCNIVFTAVMARSHKWRQCWSSRFSVWCSFLRKVTDNLYTWKARITDLVPILVMSLWRSHRKGLRDSELLFKLTSQAEIQRLKNLHFQKQIQRVDLGRREGLVELAVFPPSKSPVPMLQHLPCQSFPRSSALQAWSSLIPCPPPRQSPRAPSLTSLLPAFPQLLSLVWPTHSCLQLLRPTKYPDSWRLSWPGATFLQGSHGKEATGWGGEKGGHNLVLPVPWESAGFPHWLDVLDVEWTSPTPQFQPKKKKRWNQNDRSRFLVFLILSRRTWVRI